MSYVLAFIDILKKRTNEPTT